MFKQKINRYFTSLIQIFFLFTICNGCGIERGTIDTTSSNEYGTFDSYDNISNLSFSNRAAKLIDLNNDGYLDLILANNGISYVYFYDNTLNNFSNLQRLGSLTGDARTIKVVDLDRNGKNDLLLFSYGNRLEKYLDFESNGYTNPTLDYTYVGIDYELTDVNHDGVLDIFEARYNSSSILRLSSSGNTYTNYTINSSALKTVDIIATDFDKDGTTDVLLFNDSDFSYLITGNDDGTFDTPIAISNEAIDAVQGIVTDLNNDGLNDVIIAKDNSNVVVYLQKTSSNGTISFKDALDLTNNSINNLTKTSGMLLYDLNRDGKSDLIVLQSDGKHKVFKGKAAPTSSKFFDSESTDLFSEVSAQDTSKILFNDFNSDGKIDYVECYYGFIPRIVWGK